MRYAWLLLIALSFGPLGCGRTPEATYRRSIERATAQGLLCVVPTDDAERNVEVTEASRRLCLTRARFIEHSAPTVTDSALLEGPPSHPPLRWDEDVSCRLKPRAETGGSLKFRCMRTDAQNRLYDENGLLIPEAASFDESGRLLDSAGRRIRVAGKSLQGDELRVKYFLGEEPPVRQREMFTETVVSHLFWSLGIPVDRVQMPTSVHCFGCTADPFGQMSPHVSSEPQVFRLASVERRYDGKKIEVPRKKGWLGVGVRYDHGWGFWEIERLIPAWSPARRVEVEVLAMALHLVGYNNLHSYQNALVCRAGQWDKSTGECREVVAYVTDVGGTLGGPHAFKIEGDEDPEMQRYPRGDFVTFSQGAIFGDGRCTLRQPMGGVTRVSEAAREMLDQRARGKIGREQLRLIFEKARIHKMDKRINELVAERFKLAPGPELDRAVQLLWADELNSRFAEILGAQCPA